MVPKLGTTLKGYTGRQFRDDLFAGVIVGVVALPLAIAFAIASGLSPEKGLYTAIIAGFLISALGGSRVQIGGPTGAFVIIVYGIVQEHGLDGLIVATMMAGVALIALGLARLGGVIKYIPFPVTLGFTAGIAIVILSTQVKDFLGLTIDQVPAEFFGKWLAFLTHLGTANPSTAAIGVGTLLILIFWPRLSHRIPAPLVGLLAGTVAVTLLDLPVETIGSRFGVIDSSLPHPVFPRVTEGMLVSLAGPALTIALLAAIESLLSAVVADGMIGGRHRSNMELIGQGVANIVTPLFGGIPATGAIARTVTNVKNGGRTPVAGIIHAVTLLIITLFGARWAGLIPMATLAAILVVVSVQMSQWRTFRAELRSPKSDVVVLLTTFALTVIVDLTVAISVGMVLAAFLFIRRMAEVTNVRVLTNELSETSPESDAADTAERRSLDIPPGVEVYEINGPFFFGAAEIFKDALARIAGKPKVLIIRMRDVLALDSTGMHALGDVVHRSRKDGTTVLLADVHMQPLVALTNSQVLEEIGEDSLCATLNDALARARSLVGQPAV